MMFPAVVQRWFCGYLFCHHDQLRPLSTACLHVTCDEAGTQVLLAQVTIKVLCTAHILTFLHLLHIWPRDPTALTTFVTRAFYAGSSGLFKPS